MDVYLVCGSKSDLGVAEECKNLLDSFAVSYRMFIASAHRSPDKIDEIVEKAEQEKVKVIIALCGFAAHLPGVIAAKTTIPVVGVPLDSSPLLGVDSLLSIVQMPGGVPCAGMGIGKSGAKNAAIFAIQILALKDQKLRNRLLAYRKEQRDKIEEANRELSY
ncbi:MAG: 5-(carboxyamino)imidazole ribonucleotide mutase [Candidatus Atribacteria bacterium]|nr:5-(carboxyamino)imidazole ribonucleotide mutase [Candidatus Atribacteria bacterium]